MTPIRSLLDRLRRQPKWRFALLIAILATVGWLLRGSAKPTAATLTFVARRGPLDITVLESGSVQAIESQEIKCEARVGYQGVKILKIVEEGYLVTEDDIRTNKVLVELDSSELQKQLVQQEIQYQSAAASLTDAQQGYEIQLNQNLSDLKAAAQKARFARLDFEKFLGDKAAADIIGRLGLDAELAEAQTNVVTPTTLPALETNAPSRPASKPSPAPVSAAPPATVAIATEGTLPADATRTPVVVTGTLTPPNPSAPPRADPPADAPAPPTADPPRVLTPPLKLDLIPIDFAPYANIDLLGDGEAKQKIRELEDGLQVSRKEEGQAAVTLTGTKRLAEKGFLTKTDLERDEIAAENARLKVQKAGTARDLYLKYEFIKASEEWLSKLAEAVRELNRARKAAVSKLAQAEAKWRSAQAQYQVQHRQRKEVQEQLDKCVIPATKPGLVVYGGGGDDMYFYGGEERIREGATVRERQSIITIPDMTHMSVKVKIHESYIKQIKKGQKARITVDAFPDKVLSGEVSKVGVLPDSQNRWMNPDLKVYLTTIAITGSQDWLKPGMTAKVEIIIDRLSDVVHVPVQCIVPLDGKRVCYIAGHTPQTRPVEIGQFNDEFIEIKSGLKPGDKVLLRPPEASSPEDGAKPKAPATPSSTPAPAPAPAAPAAAPAQANS